MPWYYDPHSGGTKIPVHLQDKFRKQAEAFAKDRPWAEQFRLVVRFRNQFCYLEAQRMDEEKPTPLARLRYFRGNAWSLALFLWSHEKYEPCLFHTGQPEGTMEEAIETSEPFLI